MHCMISADLLSIWKSTLTVCCQNQLHHVSNAHHTGDHFSMSPHQDDSLMKLRVLSTRHQRPFFVYASIVAIHVGYTALHPLTVRCSLTASSTLEQKRLKRFFFQQIWSLCLQLDSFVHTILCDYCRHNTCVIYSSAVLIYIKTIYKTALGL